MAERLAPEQVTVLATSRPERPRGRKRRWGRRVVALIVSTALIVAVSVATLHFLAIQRSAQEIRATALVPTDLAANVLVVLARPGQELPLAGTLAALDEAGATVSVLSLTDGQAQPPELSVAGDRLGQVRADELQSSAELLGVDRVTTADYADGSLLTADPERGHLHDRRGDRRGCTDGDPHGQRRQRHRHGLAGRCGATRWRRRRPRTPESHASGP